MSDRLRPTRRPGGAGLLVPTRRRFLAGAAAAAFLAACGDDDSVSSGGDGGRPAGDDPAGEPELSVLRFYGGYYLAGEAARVPFGIGDSDGLLPGSASPAEVSVMVEDPAGNVVADGVTASFRDEGLPRGYYTFEFTPEEPGFFNYAVTTDEGVLPSQVQVVPADDPIFSTIVAPGDRMPPLQTPTVADPRGVTPICTREPACDLHDRTVAEVVGTAPLVVLVATPAYCQTAICGPVLDLMLDAMGEFPGATFLHVEPFTDPSSGDLEPSPAVTELGLPFEPVLYTVDAGGVVRDRLDYIFDGSEITETIGRLVG